MSVGSVVSFSQEQLKASMTQKVQVAAAKRGLDQQKIQGEAALKLMDAAALPADPNVGRNVNTYA